MLRLFLGSCASLSEIIKHATLFKLSALGHTTLLSFESETIKKALLLKVRLFLLHFSLGRGISVSVWNSSNNSHVIALNLLQTLWWHCTLPAYLIYLLQPFYICPKSKFARFLYQTVTKQYFRCSSINLCYPHTPSRFVVVVLFVLFCCLWLLTIIWSSILP